MNQPLSLWRDTPTRRAILEFVQAVATPGSQDFVPPADRIATFDNDGTLWCEKPGYIQLYFAVQRLKELAAADPSLLSQPGYKAAAEGDLAYFGKLYPDDVPEVTSRYRSLQLLLHHDDAGREYAYDRGAEKVLHFAAEHSWQVISMRDDFAQVFNLSEGISPV